MLQVAVDGGFGGDSLTTSLGASLILDGATRRLYLTLGNEDLQVVNAAATRERWVLNGINYFGTPIPGERNLQTSWDGSLDHLRYGYWLIGTTDRTWPQFRNGGAWLGGYVTPPSAIPAAGVAASVGEIAGLYDESPSQAAQSVAQPIQISSVALVFGNIEITVNLATRVVSGTMRNVRLASDEFTYAPLNDLTFSAVLDPARNQFIGTIQSISTPTSTVILLEAIGTVHGRLFGPNGQEVGGVWTLSDATHRMIGSFGTRQGVQ